MKLNNYRSLFLSFSLVMTFSFQSCSELSSSDSATVEKTINDVKDIINEKNPETKTEDKKHSEMSSQEYSTFVAKHADHLSFVQDKMVEIKNEHVKKQDHFQFDCGDESITLDRYYNDNDKIHLLTYVQEDSISSSAKHHFFWEDKLIYQFYHHSVEEGEMYVVDDHKTFFKDGKMFKCLEKNYKYKKYEDEPHDVPYELVDVNPASKLTADMEKMLTSSEAEIKELLCK